MNKIKKDVFLLRSISCGFETLATRDYSKTDEDYILLGVGTATITLVDTNPRVAAAEQLEKKKDRLRAEHSVTIEKIDNRIRELLALEAPKKGEGNE